MKRTKTLTIFSLMAALFLSLAAITGIYSAKTSEAEEAEQVYDWSEYYSIETSPKDPNGYSNNPWFGNLVIGFKANDSKFWADGNSRTVRINSSAAGYDAGHDCNFYNSQEIVDSLQKVTYMRGGKTVSAIGYYVLGQGVYYGFDGGEGTDIPDLGSESKKGDMLKISEDFTFKLVKVQGGWENRTFRYATALDYVYDGENWKVKSAVKTMSVSLKGKIEVNLGVELAGESKSDTAYLSVVVGADAEQKFYFKDATKNANGKYYFNVPVAAAQMTEEIKVKSVAGKIESELQTFTVRKYADYLLSEAANSSEELKNLVKAMLDYGAYAQQAFNVNTENLANEGIWGSAGSPVATAEVPNKTMETNGTATDLTISTLDMLLQSDNTLRLYFATSGEINNYKAVLTYNDGEERTFDLEIAKDGDRYYADVPHIPAPYLGTDYTITFTNTTDNTTCAVTVSAYAYASGLINLETATEAQKNVVKALYLYGEAAKAYNGYAK